MTLPQIKKIIFPIILGIIGFIAILVSEINRILYGSKLIPIIWFADTMITISTIVIRFYSIDPERFEQIIQETNPIKESQLQPRRFLNWMVISMIIGLTATILFAFDFVIGMLIYLLMQIASIIAFSGISFINPSTVIKHPKFRTIYAISVMFWVIAIPVIFFLLIWNGAESLIVVPYVIAIGVMACVSWFGLGYDQRSKAFRWMIVIASALFVLSDALIGNSAFGPVRIRAPILIDIPYILNILLMSHVVLFLRSTSGLRPFKGKNE